MKPACSYKGSHVQVLAVVFHHCGQQGYGAVISQASCLPHLFFIRKGEAVNIARVGTSHPSLARDFKLLLELSGGRAEGAAGDGENSTHILDHLVQALSNLARKSDPSVFFMVM